MAESTKLCVVGFVYFEVYVPSEGPPEAGTEVFVPSVPVSLGGALNTACVAQALGLPTLLLYPRGGGLCDLAIDQRVRSLSIESDSWPAPDNPAISLVYVNEKDRSFVSAADHRALVLCPTIPTTEWVHVPGLSEALHLTPQLLDARKRGAKLSVSGSWALTALHYLRAPNHEPWDLLIINADEARCVHPDIAHAIQLLRQSAHNVVVTDGSLGSASRFGDVSFQHSAAPSQGTFTNGTGDAFAAGLLTALTHGASQPDAVAFAHRVAARKMTFRENDTANHETFADIGRTE